MDHLPTALSLIFKRCYSQIILIKPVVGEHLQQTDIMKDTEVSGSTGCLLG